MKHRETRRLILQHAERLFVHKGFTEVSIAEIAAACALTKPALYYHFKDKNDIYMHVLMQGVDQLRRDLEEVMAQDLPLRARLESLLLRLADNPHNDYRSVQRTMADHFSPQERERVAAVFWQSFFNPLVEIFVDGLRSGELRGQTPVYMALAFLGMASVVASASFPGLDRARRMEMAREVVGLFFS